MSVSPEKFDRDALWMQTVSGRAVPLLNPSPDDIDLDDIAHALSHLCRFGGHTKRFYSVAEHSIYVAASIADFGGTRLEQLEGLLHDATEAYVGDVIWPLKHTRGMEGYKHIERGFETAIRQRFGLPEKMSPVVKRFDLVLLATEKRDLTSEGPGRTKGPGDVLEAGTALEELGPYARGTFDPLPVVLPTRGEPHTIREQFRWKYRVLQPHPR